MRRCNGEQEDKGLEFSPEKHQEKVKSATAAATEGAVKFSDNKSANKYETDNAKELSTVFKRAMNDVLHELSFCTVLKVQVFTDDEDTPSELSFLALGAVNAKEKEEEKAKDEEDGGA